MLVMAHGFIPFDLDQRFLLPPDLREWLPEGHLASFILEVVGELGLSELMQAYAKNTERGRAGYHPRMLLGLILYGYCTGVRSSRQIERRTHEDVAFRVLAGNQHPDHDTIADFRQRHLQIVAKLFMQVLRLCQKAGLVKLGHVCIDGTKVKANASKHKAMSYERMNETEKRLQAQAHEILAQAAATDAQEDTQYGKGKRGDELPEELARREGRLAKIRAAKAALEQEAEEKAKQRAAAAEAKNEARGRKEQETGKKLGGHPACVPDPEQAKPEPKAQRNFTDPDSRIMKDGASKSFEQCYNAQAAVDSAAQVIVAAAVTQQTNDKQQLVPMMHKTIENTGRAPQVASADAGYFSAAAVNDPSLAGINLLVPPDRQKHSGSADHNDPTPLADPAVRAMRDRLRKPINQQLYSRRKVIVEPVFGQTKEARGIRRFLLRGHDNVTAEWSLICLTHNLLKLFRTQRMVPVTAAAPC
jgi:transposase